MSRDPVQRLLVPRHVAFVGGRSLEPAIDNCRTLGFTGEVWVVNPVHDRIAGVPCLPSVTDLPTAPDAAFVGVGRNVCIEVVGELAARGTGGCVCLAGGFAEVGGDGRILQERLVAAAGDMAVMGPNCYGLLNYADRVALWPDVHGGGPVTTGAALITQSGNLALNATIADRSVPLTHVLSIGNQAVTGFGTFIDALARDPRVRAIGLYVEDLPDADGFRAAMSRATAQGVPVVALPGGVSAVGAGIVARHTGAGRTRDLRALLDELGVVTVDSLPALLETLKLLSVWGVGGPRLGVTAASGGDIAVFADLAAPTGLTFPTLASATSQALAEALGPLVSIANPLDYGTGVWGRRAPLTEVFAAVMRHDLDAAVLVIDYPRHPRADTDAWDVTVDAFLAAAARTGRRSAVVSSLPEGLPEPVRRRLLAGGTVPLQGLTEAVAALAAVANWGGPGVQGRAQGVEHAAR